MSVMQPPLVVGQYMPIQGAMAEVVECGSEPTFSINEHFSPFPVGS